MKSLLLVLAWLGQFEVVELQPSSTFLQEELKQPERKAEEVKPTFDLLTAPWCGACRDVKTALALDSRGVSAKNLPFIVRLHNVDSRGWLGASSIPAWAYEGRVFQYGYSTPENLIENYQKIIFRPTVKTKEVVKNNWPSYSGYQPRWTWPGDLRTHLRQVHGVTESLTQDQAEALHDALHEGYTLQQIRNRFNRSK